MLDRNGWPLEVGDAVTIVGACDGKSYLYGSCGVVLQTVGEQAEVVLTEPGYSGLTDKVVMIESCNVEFGRTDHVTSRALFVGVEIDIAKRSVQEAVVNAVDQSIISSELGRKILDDWLQKRISQF